MCSGITTDMPLKLVYELLKYNCILKYTAKEMVLMIVASDSKIIESILFKRAKRSKQKFISS